MPQPSIPLGSCRVPITRVSMLAAVLILVAGFTAPARAGGSWMHTTEDSYEPGEQVTAVGTWAP